MKTLAAFLLLGTAAIAHPQSSTPQATPPAVENPSRFVQELDADSAALAKIPADPLLLHDPLSSALRPLDDATHWLDKHHHLSFGATYTFLNEYATITPDSVRHSQTTGRLDLNGNWVVYDHESTAGSIGLLVRSATNIGVSQQFNLSDRLGSALVLNCLQGVGEQRPITVNILYWRQDFLAKRLSFYVGKLHPNQHISLSMYNNDERTQFLNGENDGNLAVASEGVYAGGGAVEFQITPHLFLHSLAVDTEGSAQANLKTLVDKKYLEAAEIGWFSGLPSSMYQNFRFVVYREDTKNLGSGYGGGFAFEHEFANGWTPFGRYGFASNNGNTTKQTDTIGLANIHPFHRRGDMFGAAFNYTEPAHGHGLRHESLFESFYRLRLTKSIDLGPDIQVSIHPANATKTYTTTILNARLRIIF